MIFILFRGSRIVSVARASDGQTSFFTPPSGMTEWKVNLSQIPAAVRDSPLQLVGQYTIGGTEANPTFTPVAAATNAVRRAGLLPVLQEGVTECLERRISAEAWERSGLGVDNSGDLGINIRYRRSAQGTIRWATNYAYYWLKKLQQATTDAHYTAVEEVAELFRRGIVREPRTPTESAPATHADFPVTVWYRVIREADSGRGTGQHWLTNTLYITIPSTGLFNPADYNFIDDIGTNTVPGPDDFDPFGMRLTD